MGPVPDDLDHGEHVAVRLSGLGRAGMWSAWVARASHLTVLSAWPGMRAGALVVSAMVTREMGAPCAAASNQDIVRLKSGMSLRTLAAIFK